MTIFYALIRIVTAFGLCLLSINAFTQKRFDTDEAFTDGGGLPDIGLSVAVTRNVNHSHAVAFQDLKKSVCYLLWKSDSDNDFYVGTGFLINTANNSYANNSTGEQLEIYLLTVAHNDFPNSGSGSLYLSFDYEVAHRKNRSIVTIKSDERSFIRRLWSLEVEKLVRSPGIDLVTDQIDLALYKIKTDGEHPFSIENSEVYQHVYAAGWTLHPLIKNNAKISMIGHSSGDLKKFMNEPKGTNFINNIFLKNPDKIKALSFEHNSTFNPRSGSSGSPIFFGMHVFSLLHGPENATRKGTATMIENLWKNYDDLNNTDALATWLDPNSTWISRVKGGYLKDLIQNDDTNFRLSLNKGKPKSSLNTIEIVAKDYFPSNAEIGKRREDALGHGMIVENAGGKTYLILRSNDENNTLIYGSYYDNAIDTPFKGQSWKIKDGIPDVIDGIENDKDLDSTDIQNLILDYLGVASEEEAKILGLDGAIIEAKATVQASLDDSEVSAIKFPHQMPYNAVELFDPDKLKDMWRSYHYKKSRGAKTHNGYYINSIKMEFEQHILIDGKCEALDKKTLREIQTDDNGGYLNLVGPNYEIKDIVASDPNCPDNKNKLIITLNTATENNKYYGAWLDYYPNKKGKDETNEADKYTYNFRYDTDEHSVEELELDEKEGKRITITHEVPNEDDLPFVKDVPFKTRLRLAIAKNPEIGNQLTQNGIYELGEVEDYLVEIRKANDADKGEAEKATAKIRVRGSEKESANKKPNLEDNPTDTDAVNHALDNLLIEENTQQNNRGIALAMGGALTDTGLLPNTYNPLLYPLVSLLTGKFIQAGNSNGDDFDDSDKNCGDSHSAPQYPHPDLHLDQSQNWSYWEQLNRLYNNLMRIRRFWSNKRVGLGLESGEIVAFTQDPNGNIDWQLFNQFTRYYDQIRTFRNLVNGKSSFYELLNLLFDYKISNGKTLLELVFNNSQTLELFTELYNYFLSFRCFVNQLISTSNQFEKALNFTNNSIRIALDFLGEVIPQKLTGRTVSNEIELTALPKGNDLAVIYHARGDDNTTLVGINSLGQFVYTLKIGTETTTITTDAFDEDDVLNQKINITHRFDNGTMTLFVNGEKLQSQTVATVEAFGYTNFTELNNGTRVGTPLFHFTNATANADLVALDAIHHETLFFDKAKTDESIKNMASVSTNAIIQRFNHGMQGKRAEVLKDQPQTPAQETHDISIFPNPVKNELNIFVEVERKGALRINIYDLAGKQVYQMKEPQISRGHQLITLHNLKFSPGQYIVKVKAGNVTKSESVVFE